MQALMEALDSGQYLPFGATKKRRLGCGLVFASNRSWQTLMDSVDLDEHTRLAASILELPALRERPVDIAICSALSLAKHKELTTKWQAPTGISEDAFTLMNKSAWNGNVRAVLRVIETACVSHARRRSENPLLESEEIKKALELWEPKDHPSLAKFS